MVSRPLLPILPKIEVVIPPKSNRNRYEKTARNILAGLHLVFTLFWCK